MVLAAGVAQADITWSGSATAGLARDGKVKAAARRYCNTDCGERTAKLALTRYCVEIRDYVMLDTCYVEPLLLTRLAWRCYVATNDANQQLFYR